MLLAGDSAIEEADTWCVGLSASSVCVWSSPLCACEERSIIAVDGDRSVSV